MDIEIPKRSYEFLKQNQKNTHTIKTTNTSTNESDVYVSIYACAKALDINPGIIKLCCEKKKKNNVGISKNDNQAYTFEYTIDPITKIPARKITIHNTEDERREARREASKKFQTSEKAILYRQKRKCPSFAITKAIS